jgi:hypothetical protein
MPEKLMLALLNRAEAWANRAGQALDRRNTWTPAAFAVGRRPEERALLSAAAEVYDLIGATPEGCVLMAELGLNPEAGALPSHDALAARYAEHRARVADAGAGGAA